MRKTGLIIAIGLVFLVITGLAYAIEPVGEAPKKIEPEMRRVWQKPDIDIPDVEENIDVPLPPGIARRGGDIPGEGKHLGWEKGKHKGWDIIKHPGLREPIGEPVLDPILREPIGEPVLDPILREPVIDPPIILDPPDQPGIIEDPDLDEPIFDPIVNPIEPEEEVLDPIGLRKLP